MATDTQKPYDETPSLENPKKAIAPVDLPAAKPDGEEDLKIDGSAADVVASAEDSKKEGDDSKADVADSAAGSGANPVSDIEKKMRRAERFGISVQLTEEEKRNSRAERFGKGSGSVSASTGSEVSKKSEELKRKARAERFGIASPPVPSEIEAKKKARLARFAPAPKTTDPLEDDKRKARAIRFSSTPASSLSSVNGKTDVELTAAAGNGGGAA
ncbi:hypothetical protein UlMin_005941 [Ulmus minor]